MNAIVRTTGAFLLGMCVSKLVNRRDYCEKGLGHQVDQPMNDLFGSWSRQGNFWLEADTQNQVAGTFRYEGITEGDGLLLELAQPLHHQKAVEDLFFKQPSDDAMWLHGKSEDDTYFSLTEAIARTTPEPCLTIKPRMALIGCGFARQTTTYTSVKVGIPGLTEFLQHAIEDYFCGDIMSIALDVVANGKKYGVNIYSEKDNGTKFKSWLVLAPEIAQPLMDIIAIVYEVQSFFTLIFGFPTCIDNITLETDEGVSLAGWYSFRRKSISLSPIVRNMALVYRVLTAERFEFAMKTWFASSVQFRDLTYNFFGNYFDTHPKARVNLVFYAQTLERYHLFKQKDLPLPGNLEAALKLVKDYVDQQVEQSLREGFHNVLSHLGKSQKQRLCELFQEVQSYIPLFYDNDEIQTFVDCVVTTRNYHIHGNKKRPKKLLTNEEETIAVLALKLAISFLLLKHLGVPSAAVRTTCISDFAIWQRYYKKTLGKSVLNAKIAHGSEGIIYSKKIEQGQQCFFCGTGTKLQRVMIFRYSEFDSSRVFCPNENCEGNGRFICKICGKGLIASNRAVYCSHCEGFKPQP